MKELGWSTFEELLEVILAARQEGKDQIVVAVLSKGADFDCELATLQSKASDPQNPQEILELLKGNAKVIIRRLIAACVPFAISGTTMEIILDNLRDDLPS